MAAYIKFQRGSLAAYKALPIKDPNTLYFIYAEENAPTGSLYLGESLISGGDVVVQSTRLEDLADVLVKGAKTGSFLVKGNNGKWIAKQATEIAQEILSSFKVDKSLSISATGELGIAGFADAAVGTYLVKGENGELIWTASGGGDVNELQSAVEALENQIGKPASTDSEATGIYAEMNAQIAEAIANAGHLKRSVVQELPSISDAKENTIYIVSNPSGENGNFFDEYILNDGAWEKLGSTNVNLEGYVTTETFNSALALKVDKVDGSRLMSNLEGLKLAGIAEKAEVNVINGVSSEFTIDSNRNLILNNISASKVVNLEDTLNNLLKQSEDFKSLNNRVDNLETRTTWIEM